MIVFLSEGVVLNLSPNGKCLRNDPSTRPSDRTVETHLCHCQASAPCAPQTPPFSYPRHLSAGAPPAGHLHLAGEMLTCGRFLSSSAATTTASFSPLRTLTRSLLRRPHPRLLSSASAAATTAVEPDTKGKSLSLDSLIHS